MMFSTLSRAAAFFALLTAASASPLEKRDVWTPPVLNPNASTVWVVGQSYNVTWDASNPPQQITDKLGHLILRTMDSIFQSGPGSFDDPLAANFPLLDGSVEVTVPDVPTGLYAVVLFGDSGDNSEYFTITQPTDSA